MQVNKEQKKRKKAKKEKSTSDDKRKKRRKTRENEAENEDEDGHVLSKENKVISVCKVLLITTKTILTWRLEQRSSVSVNQIVASLDDF